MKILNICRKDYAGVGIKITQAVNKHTGHTARHLCTQVHGLGFEHDIATSDKHQMQKWLRWADVVNCHVYLRPLAAAGYFPKNLIITWHGTHYRTKTEKCHASYKKHKVKRALCTTADLTKYGVAEWLPVAIPIGQYRKLRRKRTGGKPIVCQTPPRGRGSAKGHPQGVLKVLGGRKDIDLRVSEKMPHSQVLRYKATADVYIDRFQLGLGVNGLEALAMKIPVIAHAQPEDEACIIREVGYLPYYDAPLSKLADAVDDLLSNPTVYREHVERACAYMENFHAYPVVAARYAKICAAVVG